MVARANVGLLLATLALGATACAGPARVARPVTASRIELRGFSVVPPRGPDWFEMPSMGAELRHLGGSYGVVFIKGFRPRPPSTPSEAETVLAMVVASVVTPATPDEVLDDAIRRRRAEVGHGRFGSGTLSSTREGWAGAACRRYEFSLEDYGHPRFPEAVFVLAGRGLLCAHPQEAGLVIDAYFSQRTQRGHRPVPVTAEVQLFLDSLAFMAVR